MNKLLSTIENDEALLELFYPYFYVSEKEKDKTILDYGCGYGWGSSYLAKDSKRIVGYDIDSSRIDYANNEYGYLKNVIFVSSYEEIQPNTFDAVILSHVLQKESNILNISNEILSSLKEEGNIYICFKALFETEAKILIDAINTQATIEKQTWLERSAGRFGKVYLVDLKIRKEGLCIKP